MCTAKPRPVISKFQVASEAERIARGCGFRQLPGGNPSERKTEKSKLESGDFGVLPQGDSCRRADNLRGVNHLVAFVQRREGSTVAGRSIK